MIVAFYFFHTQTRNWGWRGKNVLDIVKKIRAPLRKLIDLLMSQASASEKGAGGALAPCILKFSAKNGCFPSFKSEKSNLPLLPHPWKNLGKIL